MGPSPFVERDVLETQYHPHLHLRRLGPQHHHRRRALPHAASLPPPPQPPRSRAHPADSPHGNGSHCRRGRHPARRADHDVRDAWRRPDGSKRAVPDLDLR